MLSHDESPAAYPRVNCSYPGMGVPPPEEETAMALEKEYRELPRRVLYEEMKLHLFSLMS